MKYYYDILLNFNEYPIHYYEWNSQDELERIKKIPVYHVENIVPYIKYHMKIEDMPNQFILSDGINAVALELINGSVAYLSYLSYEDESCVIGIVANLDITNIKYKKGKVRYIPFELRTNMLIKKLLLKEIEESSIDFIKYVYYDITGKDNDDIEYMKVFLLDDISKNFNDKYVNLYQKLCQ